MPLEGCISVQSSSFEDGFERRGWPAQSAGNSFAVRVDSQVQNGCSNKIATKQVRDDIRERGAGKQKITETFESHVSGKLGIYGDKAGPRAGYIVIDGGLVESVRNFAEICRDSYLNL